MRRGGPLAAVLGAAAVLLTLLLATDAPVSRPPGSALVALPDSFLVYCLTDLRRDRLVEAANLLGVVRPGSQPGTVRPSGAGEMTLQAWAAYAPGNFERACGALMVSEGAPAAVAGSIAASGKPGTSPLLSALVGACLSACLTYSFVEWRTLRDRRRAAADRLRADSAQLRRLVCAIATQRANAVTARPSPVEVFAVRDDLTAQISKIRSRSPRWTVCGELLALLVSPPHVALLTSAWSASPAGRARSAEGVTAWAIAIEVGVDRLAEVVERPTLLSIKARRMGFEPVPHGGVPT